ncbi:MAG: hypothetical protein EOM52_04895 [Clostridia bacterium]|nr:hypothetical protein [Clostridia bacterium]
MGQKRKPYEIVEVVFDAAYLLFAIGAGVYMLLRAGDNTVLRLYGALALILGCGDAFHLVPRIYGSLTGTMAKLTKPLGLGKLVTSITMTVFYVLLCHVFTAYYGMAVMFPVIYALAAVRIALCLFPQNGWFSEDAPLSWAVARNVPFALLGMIVIILFAVAAPPGDVFRFMPLAVALSFGFYLPVVLWAQKIPAIGALMLPKTLAYVWIICMGFGLM